MPRANRNAYLMVRPPEARVKPYTCPACGNTAYVTLAGKWKNHRMPPRCFGYEMPLIAGPVCEASGTPAEDRQGRALLRLSLIDGNCEYTGNNFKEAQKMAKRVGAAIYGPSADRGQFLVMTEAQEQRMWPRGVPRGWSRLNAAGMRQAR